MSQHRYDTLQHWSSVSNRRKMSHDEEKKTFHWLQLTFTSIATNKMFSFLLVVRHFPLIGNQAWLFWFGCFPCLRKKSQGVKKRRHCIGPKLCLRHFWPMQCHLFSLCTTFFASVKPALLVRALRAKKPMSWCKFEGTYENCTEYMFTYRRLLFFLLDVLDLLNYKVIDGFPQMPKGFLWVIKISNF